MEIDEKEVEQYINEQSQTQSFRYQTVWNVFKEIIKNSTAEGLEKHAVDFCKSTLRDKLLQIGRNRITKSNLQTAVRETATSMSILKYIVDNFTELEDFLKGRYIQRENSISFGDGLVKEKLQELISEGSVTLSDNDIKIIKKYLSKKPVNVIKFFDDEIKNDLKRENGNTRSRLNSFLNYLSPQRVEAIERFSRGQKDDGKYKSDLEVLNKIQMNDVYNVCRKIIWETICKHGLTDSIIKKEGTLPEDSQSIPENIKNEIIPRMSDILSATSKCCDKYKYFKNSNPITVFKDFCGSNTIRNLTQFIFELANYDTRQFAKEMRNDKDVYLSDSINRYNKKVKGEAEAEEYSLVSSDSEQGHSDNNRSFYDMPDTDSIGELSSILSQPEGEAGINEGISEDEEMSLGELNTSEQYTNVADSDRNGRIEDTSVLDENVSVSSENDRSFYDMPDTDSIGELSSIPSRLEGEAGIEDDFVENTLLSLEGLPYDYTNNEGISVDEEIYSSFNDMPETETIGADRQSEGEKNVSYISEPSDEFSIYGITNDDYVGMSYLNEQNVLQKAIITKEDEHGHTLKKRCVNGKNGG